MSVFCRGVDGVKVAILCILTSLAFHGCALTEEQDTSPLCDGEVVCQISVGGSTSSATSVASNSSVGGAITPFNPLAPGQAVTILGSCEQTAGVAIRNLRIAGQVVENLNDSNYSEQWRTSVPYDIVAAFDNGDFMAQLEVKAVDACGAETLLPPVEIAIDPTPGKAVTEIRPRVHYPRVFTDFAGNFLPLNGSALAELEIRANREAVGAAVRLTASDGVLILGGSESGTTPGQVRDLAFTKEGSEAVARVFLMGDFQKENVLENISDVLVRVSAPDYNRSEVVLVKVAKAPGMLRVGSNELSLGQSASVVVTSPGFETCWASYAEGFKVCLGESAPDDCTNDLSAAEAQFDLDTPARRLTITVRRRSANADELVVVNCMDYFGQVSSMGFNGKAEVIDEPVNAEEPFDEGGDPFDGNGDPFDGEPADQGDGSE